VALLGIANLGQRAGVNRDQVAQDLAARVHGTRRVTWGEIWALCLRITGNPTEAEDLTQDAFLQLFRKMHTFRGESRFSTWLHRLAVNVVLMQLRKKRCPEISLDATSEPGEEDSRPLIELGGPDLRLSGVLDHINLSKAIEQLPDGYKEMFILHDVEGYEHKEIAEILGCSIGNSKSQLFKARLRLRKLLQEVLRSRARERRESSLHDGESFQSVCRVRRSQLKRQFGPLLAHAQKRDLGRPVVAKEVEHRDRFEAACVTAPAPKNRAFGSRQQVRMSRASRSMRLPAHR
jgi:RNA polymerase sigma-70 factor (ECF subfamily)